MIHSFLEFSGESMSIGATRRMLSIFRKLRKFIMASYGCGVKKVKMKQHKGTNVTSCFIRNLVLNHIFESKMLLKII